MDADDGEDGPAEDGEELEDGQQQQQHPQACEHLHKMDCWCDVFEKDEFTSSLGSLGSSTISFCVRTSRLQFELKHYRDPLGFLFLVFQHIFQQS